MTRENREHKGLPLGEQRSLRPAALYGSQVLGFSQLCADWWRDSVRSYSARALTSSGWIRGLQNYKPAGPSSQRQKDRAKGQPRPRKSFRTKTKQ